MLEERLFELIHPMLRQAGATLEPGEVFPRPALEILRYYRRVVRYSKFPILGKALSIVAIVRQPVDLELSDEGYARLLARLAQAANSRFPPWRGLAIGLTTLVLTAEPIAPGDDAVLGRVLRGSLRRYRVVPVGLIRVNLGQEAVSFTLTSSPGELFIEPARLADVLSEHLRRFVPLIEI